MTTSFPGLWAPAADSTPPSIDVLRPKTAHRPEWRRFTKTDWYGYAGATPFPNGDEPWIADIHVDGLEASVVVDANGIQIDVYVPDEGDDDFEVWCAAGDLNAVLGFSANTSRVELERLGFNLV